MTADVSRARVLHRRGAISVNPPSRFDTLGALLRTAGSPRRQFCAAQALQRVPLTATSAGVSASFLSQPIEVRDLAPADRVAPWLRPPRGVPCTP
jgi:hypothetical protein